MKIPQTWRKKALIIVDVQDTFILERNKGTVNKIIKLIDNIDYDLIINSTAYNTEDSLWCKQVWWSDLIWKKESINSRIKYSIWTKRHILINKISKSVFKADYDISLELKHHEIEELHFVWYESNDCIIASAMESFDLGFYTFVIEEATETGSTKSNHKKAIDILNYLNLTNKSKFVGYEKTDFKEI